MDRELSPQTGLVGHDGWADARLGDFGRSDVFLNDYVAIQELRKWKGHFALDKPALREALNVLGDEAARHLEHVLQEAVALYPAVIAAPYVSPFKAAAWYNGRHSDDNYLPHCSCRAVGDVMRKTMQNQEAPVKVWKCPLAGLVFGLLAFSHMGPCAAADNGQIVLEDDITYGKAGDTELKLDLARPQGEGPFPAIVFIHGGGWSGGNRQAYRGQIQEAARRGYVAATISYRLMKFDESKKETTTATPIFPAQIHDAKAAIRWVRAHAKKYHVNADRIGVTGGSAGGHLSLLVGLTDPASNLEGESGNPEQSSRVQAVVNVFGPTDMAFCYEKSSVAWIFRLFMGGTYSEAAERYKAASPLTYVSKDDPPVLTLHGDKDALVPVEQARVLDEKMKAVGANHTLMVFEGQGHGFGGESGKKAADATWKFFDQHLKP